MFGFFFTEQKKVSHFNDVMSCNGDHFKQFFHSMLNAGINLAPSAFEAGFSSSAHSEEDINNTITAAGEAFEQLSSNT